jgi:hypothetical protein
MIARIKGSPSLACHRTRLPSESGSCSAVSMRHVSRVYLTNTIFMAIGIDWS